MSQIYWCYEKEKSPIFQIQKKKSLKVATFLHMVQLQNQKYMRIYIYNLFIYFPFIF